MDRTIWCSSRRRWLDISLKTPLAHGSLLCHFAANRTWIGMTPTSAMSN
jgi:hypothetical protein